MNVRATRVFSALIINLLFLAFAGSFLYYLGGGQSALADVIREQYSDNPGALEDIQSEAIWRVIMWLASSLAFVWVLASIWLNIAESHRPANPREGRQKRGVWVVFLVLCLISFIVIGWVRVVNPGTFSDLSDSIGAISWITVGTTVFLAYLFSTALSVKTVMKPSVPFGMLLPSFVRSK